MIARAGADGGASVEALARRLHAFGRNQLDRELAEGFPLVRSVRSGLARYVAESLERMEPAARTRLCDAFVARFWGTPYGHAMLSPEDQRVVDAWLEGAMRFDSGAPGPRPRLDRRRVAGELCDALAPVVGELDREASVWPTLLSFRTTLGGWAVRTFLDIGGRYEGLTYSHQLGAAPGWPVTVSLMGWLGISSSTSWDDFGDADAPAVVGSVVRLCRHFFEAAPALLGGIEPPPAAT